MATKTIHYKHAAFLQDGDTTLQSLIESAVKKLDAVEKRVTEPTAHVRNVLNDHKKRAGCFCGNLVQYIPDKELQLITLLEGVKSQPVSQERVPADKEGRTRETLEGTFHFAVFENHIGFVGSASLRANHLQTYLNEFLSKAGQLHEDDLITLQDAPANEVKEMVRKRKIKKVIYGESLEFKPAARSDSDDPHRVKTVKLTPTGRVAEVLKAAFGGDGWKTIFSRKSGLAPDSDEITAPENLRVQLEVGFFRRSSDDDQEVLQQLAQLVLSNDDDDRHYEVELKDKTRIRGNDLLIKGSFSADEVGRIIPTDAYFDGIASWLVQSYRDGLLPT